MTEAPVARPDALGEAPLLRGASAHAVEQLRESGSERRLAAHEWLFRAGEPSDRLFVVLSGRLQAVDDEGRILRELGAGAALGELGLLTGSARSASVRAVRDCRLLEIDAERFGRLVEEDGGLAVSIARELARQLQASGGLDVPEVRPSVFALVAAGRAPVGELVGELEVALGRFGSVATLDGELLAADDFAHALDQAELSVDYVLLVEGAGGQEWSTFCRRQCDRLLVAVEDEPPGPEWRRRPEECELLFVGASDETIERWLDEAAPRTHHVITSGAGFRAGIERAARRLTGRSLGLVLSGGGARGLAHIGALAALADAGFVLDRIGGCSMGSFIAAMAALGHDADEIEATCSRELVRRSPFNDYTLPRVSLIRARKAGVMLDRVFGSARMESLERPLYTVSADLISSLVVVHRRGPIFEAVGASMNLPGLVPPLRRNGRLLVDGGVLNNLPVDHMAESNEGPIVAVDVVRRVDAGESEQPLPSITETLARATVLGSVERAERNRALALVLVTPEVQGIALREWSALAAAVEAGRHAAEETLEAGGADALRAALG